MTTTSLRTRACRLLAIDDSLTICKMVELSMQNLGHHLDVARTGQEGIERARRHPPHLILLDFVLPDMEGHEICRALGEDERTRHLPILIMSAKVQEVKPLFADNPSIVGFLSKPFTSEALRFHIEDALRKIGSADKSASGQTRVLPRLADEQAVAKAFSYAQQEAAAKALYHHLSERFARIPEWMSDVDRERPGLHFARRILTPELMPRLMDALLPVYRELLGTAPAAGSQAAPAEAPILSGEVGLLGIRRFLNLLAEDRQTGLLEVDHEGRTDRLYLRLGQIVFATHNRPELYVRQGPWSSQDFPPDEWERAETEQRRTGRPVYLGLASLQERPAAEMTQALFEQGKRVLCEVLEIGAGTFRWLHPPALPDYVEAHAQPYPLEQLHLEGLRQVDDWAQIEVMVNSLDLVFARGQDLLNRLPRYELNAVETQVLNRVNGRRSVRQLTESTGLPPFQIFQALFCLHGVGLVRRVGEGAARSDRRPTVMVLDPDVEGVHEPLARLLRRRQIDPISLVSLNGEKDGCNPERWTFPMKSQARFAPTLHRRCPFFGNAPKRTSSRAWWPNGPAWSSSTRRRQDWICAGSSNGSAPPSKFPM